MEREIKCEGVSKITVSNVKSYFSEESFPGEDFFLSPLTRLRSMSAGARCFEGMTVGIICNGTAKAVINDRTFELRANSLFLLGEGSVIQSFRCSKACEGYIASYSKSFVDSMSLDTSDLLSTDITFNMRPCIEVGRERVVHLQTVATAIRTLAAGGDMVYNDKVILSLFNALYYALASVVNSSITEDNADRHGSRSDALVHRFVAELGASCDKERSVEYYAKQLGVTPKYLSLVCKNKLGKNASKVIDGVVVNRAKELLMQPGISIQEVAERLNFVSQSFFGKYFKQRTGVSPSRYKVQN